MARFTRSSASENPPSSSPKPLPVVNKKRKRASSPSDDQSAKSQRTLSPPIPSVGDVPLNSEMCLKILDILQPIDSQGLLDRISDGSLYSLRTLLQDSSNHPLSELRSAVQHFFPISLRNPRSRPSDSASQQQTFCNLVLSLLNQASVQSVPFPGDLETLIPDDSSSSSSSHIHQKSRYALVQHLPSGDYWTSISSETSSSELKGLPKGHSELVAILPSPSPSTSISDVPTLGSYHKSIIPHPKHQPQAARKVSSGSFLDYGVYASFAPSFDQDCAELGRQELGHVLFARKAKSSLQEKQLKKWDVDREKEKSSETRSASPSAEQVKPVIDVETELDELLPPDQVEAIKAGLGSLELELAVAELLERNQRALRRLQELQKQRLMADGASSRPEEGSEEWDTAQAILDSLTALTSLRPRSSKHENAPLIPPAAVLHALHRTLPISPSPGWYGNLPPGRSVIRDDSTLKVKPGAPAATAAATATSTPTPAPSATPAISNSGYTYNPYSTSTIQQNYRPGAASTPAAPYVMYSKPTTSTSGATSYYPNYTSSHQQIYGSAYTGAGATAYAGSYYSPYTTTATANGSGSGSGSGGRGTPVNSQQPTSFAHTYSSFFSNTNTSAYAQAAAAAINGSTGIGTPQVRIPAVANTVTNTKPTAPSTPTTVQPALTLPAHLRSVQSMSQAQDGTQLPVHFGQLGQQSNFYGLQTGVTTQYTPTSITTTTTPTPAK